MTLPKTVCYQPFYCEENIWQFVVAPFRPLATPTRSLHYQ